MGRPATYGVGGTGSTPQATLTLGANVIGSASSFGKFGALTVPTYHEALESEVKNLTPFGAGSLLTGTYSPGGTFVEGQAAQLATDRDAVAIVAGSILTTVTGLLGTVDGTFDLDAYEAGRNSDPGIANVVDGVPYEILGVSLEGTYESGDLYTYGSNVAAHVLTIATGNPGTYDATNLSVGNVIQDVTFGVGQTGTGANLLATHTTYLSLEAGRNSKTAGAAQILTGYSVTIAGVATNGTAIAEAHTANQVLKSAGGNYNDDNLSVGNVRPVTFGLSQTGTLANLAATDSAYVSLEATRNSKTAGADQILTGYSVTIAGIVTSGTFNEAVRNTDPGVENVIDGITYKILGVSLEGELIVGSGIVNIAIESASILVE